MFNVLVLTFFSLSFSSTVAELEDRCVKNDAQSCFELAYEYSKKGDQLKPIFYFEKACELKDGKSCYALSKVLKKLGQLERNEKLIDMSCDYNFSLACLEISEKLFLKKDYLSSISYLEKSCELKNEKACISLENRQAYMSKVVRSSPEELSEKEKVDQQDYLKLINSRITKRISNCEAKVYDECTLVAKDYLFLANIKEAKKWAEIACNNSMPLGCLTLGEVEQREGKEQLPAFEKACNLKNSTGCSIFAQSIEKVNLSKAMSFYRLSCEMEVAPNAEACKIYSEYNSKNEIITKKYLDLACKIDKTYCRK